MLCHDTSSLSRGSVVRMRPLVSSIRKHLTPSSLLSKKWSKRSYLTGLFLPSGSRAVTEPTSVPLGEFSYTSMM
ncbi:hypothetical protein EYF80_033725 [Liparis tanakae]|uniref:Uncharacterized protein n=1 Tax=Liparis tanakae TaxID=230148 RepID=A0A4Z2GU07_9TELE|nr:hypothetical protein EYF80_033725 [Liparis tanakae]